MLKKKKCWYEILGLLWAIKGKEFDVLDRLLETGAELRFKIWGVKLKKKFGGAKTIKIATYKGKIN